MGKRFIRLKELPPGLDISHTPTVDQVECSDGTLGAGPFRCRTDEHGFLITGNHGVEGRRPLVFMGDSFVESMYAQETERFVARVERALAVNGRQYRCLNAGYSGASSLQLLNVLINKIYAVVGPGAPVVFFVPQSDRDNVYVNGSYWNNLQRGAVVLPPGAPGHPGIPEGAEATRAVLRLVVDAASHLGLRLVLATSPYRVGDFGHDAALRRIYRRDRERYELSSRRRAALCEAVREVATLTDTPLLDAKAMLGGEPGLFYDELHLNDFGHEQLGRLVSETLPPLLTGEAEATPAQAHIAARP